MTIIEPVIRPPAEAYSFLLQVTTGCSANDCTFCGAYINKQFSIKSLEEVFSDIDAWSVVHPDTRRVFLMDGDALVLSNAKLVPILKRLAIVFPKLQRISAYANGYNITVKSNSELQELFDHKLKLIYMGLESGSQTVLDKCKKKASVRDMVAAVQRASEVGIKSSVIVLLGLGGQSDSDIHVQETIKVLNEMQPRLLSFVGELFPFAGF